MDTVTGVCWGGPLDGEEFVSDSPQRKWVVLDEPVSGLAAPMGGAEPTALIFHYVTYRATESIDDQGRRRYTVT